MIIFEVVIKDVERVIYKFSVEVFDNEYEMKL